MQSLHVMPRRNSSVRTPTIQVSWERHVNVDEDLMMAVQTLKSRGLDTHEEVVHSNTAIALGIHNDLRNIMVSVAPMRLWRLKQDLRWALRCWAPPGAHDLCGPAQTGRVQCAFLRSKSSFGRITTTLRDCGQVPEPKCELLSVFCRQS